MKVIIGQDLEECLLNEGDNWKGPGRVSPQWR